MKLLIIFALALSGTHGLLAMDPPKQVRVEFPQTDGATFIKESLLYDIKNVPFTKDQDLVESPLYVETLRLGSPEVYKFLRIFFTAINHPDEEKNKKQEDLRELLAICLSEADGGREELNCSNKVYKPLKDVLNKDNEKDIWSALSSIADEVISNLALNIRDYEKIREGYTVLISPPISPLISPRKKYGFLQRKKSINYPKANKVEAAKTPDAKKNKKDKKTKK